MWRNRNVRKSNEEKVVELKQHSDHKAVYGRKRANIMTVNVYVVFANSQPSAVDGLKCTI